MNSIYLGLQKFVSTIFCSVQCTNLLHLVRFIPKYFIFLILFKLYFKIFIFWWFVALCRNRIYFCMLILHPGTVVNSIVLIAYMCVDPIRNATGTIISSANKKFYFFLTQMNVSIFSSGPWLESPMQSWIKVARMSFLVLLLIFGGKHSIFHHEVGCYQLVFLKVIYGGSLYLHLGEFLSGWCWVLSNGFPVLIGMITCCWFFAVILVSHMINDMQC